MAISTVMSPYARHVNAIIIGAGPSGIAMSYRMKHELGFDDFTIYDKLSGVGGTWRTNTYPGWLVVHQFEKPRLIYGIVVGVT